MTKHQRGERVIWVYVHCLGVSRTRRIKIGAYLGQCRHTSKHWRHAGSQQLAWVQFDGNKRRSRIPYSELIFDTGKGSRDLG